METLPALNFSDLASRARTHAARARGANQKSWLTLADLISECSTPSPSPVGDLVSEAEPWWIETLTVSGFRGVNEEVTCRFDASPGLTVIHGSNGSGKSSLCHALDLTLHQDEIGSGPAPVAGAGGKAPLWKPVFSFGGGTTPPTVRVTLRRAGREAGLIELAWGIDEDSRQVALNGKPLLPEQLQSWKSALARRLPVYSYADWERRMTVAKDMQSYLYSLLAFGGLFAAIDEKLDALEAENGPGVALVRSAHATLEAKIKEVADEFDYHSSVPIPPWPLLSEIAATESAVESEFSTQQGRANALDADSILTLRQSVADLVADLSGLDLAAARQEALESALTAIYDAEGLDQEHCPVCGTPGDWRGYLQRHLQKSAQGRAAMGAWESSLATVLHQAQRVMTLSPALADSEHPLHALGAALTHLGATASTAPHLLDDETVTAVRAVQAELGADSFGGRLRELADENRAIITAQARLQMAFETFLRSWRDHADELAQAQSIKEMRNYLRVLENECSGERAEAVTQATDPIVRDLLTDAGIRLGGVKVQRRTAAMALQWSAGTDSNSDGENPAPLDMEMGMLSAGQRNAVILAPALAVAQGGPFAFRVFDDPVHAFDQFRIDRVSEAFLDLARTQRVVIMTHDERFKEHLATIGLCRGVEVEVHEMGRQPGGEITLRRTQVMWLSLIEDAQSLFDLNQSTSLATTIRGLLRQSVDNALRAFVVSQAFRESGDVEEWISKLDLGAVMTTERRFEVVLDLPIPSSAKESICEAKSLSEKHKTSWNRAAHGNPPESAVCREEIDDCRRIGNILWGSDDVL